MQQLNYNHLYYFWVIAKEGGVTQACKRLNLAQPTLSAQLKIFEQHVGRSLFQRKARRLVLNETGKMVFDYADAIFKKCAEMLETLHGSSDTKGINFNVGVVPELARKNMHNYLKTPLQHGHVHLSLYVDGLGALLKALSSHQLDMVLSPRPPRVADTAFVSHVLERVPVVFVASPEFKSLRRRFPVSLQGQDVFLPGPQSETRVRLDAYFKKIKVEPHIRGSVYDMELLRVIAVAGHGVVATPRTAVSDLIKSKALYIIGDNIDVWQEFYLITAERKEQHPMVRAILKRLG